MTRTAVDAVVVVVVVAVAVVLAGSLAAAAVEGANVPPIGAYCGIRPLARAP